MLAEMQRQELKESIMRLGRSGGGRRMGSKAE